MPAVGPVVLVPVGVDEDALDACLAALESSTPAGTRIWLADDAQAGPRAGAIIDGWLARTRLQAAHTRRTRSIGEAAHLDDALRACGDADVAILAADARPTPGWLQQLSACLARDPTIATATPWSNAGEAAAWPRIGEITALDEDPSRLARACAQLPSLHPDLPAAVGHAVLVRGGARARVGGLDAASFHSWYAALTDFSLRLSGLGWRNALCETAFVLRANEGHALDGDMQRLSVRWPAWHARLAHFLMDDPLAGVRAQLGERLASLDSGSPQPDLFALPP
ncbi:MAG: glycosyltransferase [Thermomonas sp.]